MSLQNSDVGVIQMKAPVLQPDPGEALHTCRAQLIQRSIHKDLIAELEPDIVSFCKQHLSSTDNPKCLKVMNKVSQNHVSELKIMSFGVFKTKQKTGFFLFAFWLLSL